MNSYICALLFNGICRVSVPIFFMISGALILEQTVNYKKSLKRTGDILIKTVVWSVIFIIWDFFYLAESYNFQLMFAVPVRVHFWFLYVMVGIYLTVPLWQKLVSGASKELVRYFSIVFISVLGLIFVLTALKMPSTYHIPLFGASAYAGYFIMGYIIRHYIDEIKIKKWICALIIAGCALATDVFTLGATLEEGSHIETFSDFKSVFIAVAAMTVFYLFMKMKEPKHRKWITAISNHSFNIYMMHVFFLDIIQQNIDITKFTAWLGFPVFFVFLISASFGFSWIFEKAKGCRKLIF